MLNILVADDHEVVRRGLKDILRDAFPKAHIAGAENASQLLALAMERKWDLILLDIVMPGSNVLDVMRNLRAIQPAVPILILTAAAEVEYAVSTIKAGANGFITKQYAATHLVDAIKKVLAGETYLSREAVNELAASVRQGASQVHDKLTPRELEVFRMIASGQTIKEIARELGLSDKTVGTHVGRIKEKTNLASYVEITRYALQHRLVK